MHVGGLDSCGRYLPAHIRYISQVLLRLPTLTEHPNRCWYRSASSELKVEACKLLQKSNSACSLPLSFQHCLHNNSRCGHKWPDAACLRRAGDTQQATEIQKQHEQVQQQMQVAEQQLEAAFTGKTESEQQLLTAQQGLDRYTTTLSVSVGIMLQFAVLSCAIMCCAAP